MSCFDLIAVQEVNENLSEFEDLMRIMGRNWDYIMTDVAGNQERMVFVFDRNRVSFQKLAGEVVLTKSNEIKGTLQFNRTPFVVAFQAGWFKFKLCTVHIIFGGDTEKEIDHRTEEISSIAENIKKRSKKYKENFILLGDFNIIDKTHRTMKALEKHDFYIPDAIKDKPSNMFRTKHYDQIAFNTKGKNYRFGDSDNSAGALDFYGKVYSEEQFEDYKAEIVELKKKYIAKKKEAIKNTSKQEDKDKFKKQIDKTRAEIASNPKLKKYYLNSWRTWQMSDHLPMWTELKINFSVPYLDRIKSE
jgi:endonuclease/exonuclease/phosphatase family metal-dependent hydrolase